MNKKGFTLIELLACIVLIGIVSLLGTTTYSKIQESVKEKQYNNLVKEIEIAAKEYYEKTNVNKIYVQALINSDLLLTDDKEGNILDPRDGSSLNCYYYDIVKKSFTNEGASSECENLSIYADINYCMGKNCTPTETINEAIWLKGDYFTLGVTLNDSSKEILSYKWYVKSSLEYDETEYHLISSKNKRINLKQNVNVVTSEGDEISISKKIKIDNVLPEIIDWNNSDEEISATLVDKDSGIKNWYIEGTAYKGTSEKIKITEISDLFPGDYTLIVCDNAVNINNPDDPGNCNKKDFTINNGYYNIKYYMDSAKNIEISSVGPDEVGINDTFSVSIPEKTEQFLNIGNDSVVIDREKGYQEANNTLNKWKESHSKIVINVASGIQSFLNTNKYVYSNNLKLQNIGIEQSSLPKTEFKFRGWNIFNGNSKIGFYSETTEFSNLASNGDTITFIAQWEPKKTRIPTISIEGHECIWNTKHNNSGLSYNSGEMANIKTETDLYAICTPESYILTITGGSYIDKIYYRDKIPADLDIRKNECNLNINNGKTECNIVVYHGEEVSYYADLNDDVDYVINGCGTDWDKRCKTTITGSASVSFPETLVKLNFKYDEEKVKKICYKSGNSFKKYDPNDDVYFPVGSSVKYCIITKKGYDSKYPCGTLTCTKMFHDEDNSVTISSAIDITHDINNSKK